MGFGKPRIRLKLSQQLTVMVKSSNGPAGVGGGGVAAGQSDMGYGDKHNRFLVEIVKESHSS